MVESSKKTRGKKGATQPLVSLVVVDFNGSKYLKKCLPSLKNLDYKNVEIIVVENGSDSKHVELIKKEFPYVIKTVDSVLMITDEWTPGVKNILR